MTIERRLRIEPLTPERWPDLEALFGPGGAAYGCWCMDFRRTSAEMAHSKASDNRADLRSLAAAEPAPGLLAYERDVAVGWVGLGPRSTFPRLVRSRTLTAVDDRPTWSIVCFYVARERRGEGIARALLDGAIAYAEAHGAPLIEGYARDAAAAADAAEPADTRLPADYAYPGTVALFAQAGFQEAARYEPKGSGRTARVTMRRELGPG